MNRLYIGFLASLTVLAGCIGTVHEANDTGEPLLVLHSRLSGQIPDRMPQHLVASLSWSLFPDGYIECLEAASTPEEHIACDEEFFERPTLELAACMEQATTDTEKTACVAEHFEKSEDIDRHQVIQVEPRFPVSFDFPIYTLPSSEDLPERGGSRFGLASLSIWIDLNNDGDVDWDAAKGIISGYEGMDLRMASQSTALLLLVYVEGDLTTAWDKIAPGCPEPDQGYSVMKRSESSCQFIPASDAIFELELMNGARLSQHLCDQSATKPPAERPADTFTCVDWDHAQITTDPDLYCGITDFYLKGCESDPTCTNAEWDMTGNPPHWWPCSTSSFTLTDSATALTSNHDALFSISYDQGILAYTPENLQVMVRPQGETSWHSFGADNLEFIDNDNNSQYTQGDLLNVTEWGIDFYNASHEGQSFEVWLTVRHSDESLQLIEKLSWTP